MGLAAAILLVISGISIIDLTSAGGIALLVAALAGLFTVKYFFILEKGWKYILRGKNAGNEQTGVHQTNAQFDEVKKEDEISH